MGYFKTLSLLLLLSIFCDAANILYIIPFTSKSHYILLRPIGLELASRGHNVTVITAFREKVHPPTYHQVMSDDIKIWEAFGEAKPNIFSTVDMPMEVFHEKILWKGGIGTTEVVFKSKEVENFLKKDNSFDLVISELFFQEAFFALAHKYKAPLVLVTTHGNNMRTNVLLRNPWQIATVMHEYATNRYPHSFMGRLLNLYHSLYDLFFWRLWYLEKQEELVRKYLNDLPRPMPSLLELQMNASLVLYNTHFSVDTPAAYLPNIIEVAGLHLKESDIELPEDLKNILDNAKDGVVYINFGTNLQSNELPEEKLNAFLNVFRRLKQTVIFKWEEINLKNKPNNVVIRPWFPQKEIFAHPNVKLFISHGGLIGTQEAIFNGIPIVGIPIYCDQFNNLLKVQEDGHGKILEFNDINEDNLYRLVDELLTDPTYARKAKEMQIRFKDRPITAMETAIFWIEYVIRHNGANFAKNPALKLNWIAYNMLDVYGIILVMTLLICGILLKIVMLFKNLLLIQKIRKPKDVRKKRQ